MGNGRSKVQRQVDAIKDPYAREIAQCSLFLSSSIDNAIKKSGKFRTRLLHFSQYLQKQERETLTDLLKQRSSITRQVQDRSLSFSDTLQRMAVVVREKKDIFAAADAVDFEEEMEPFRELQNDTENLQAAFKQFIKSLDNNKAYKNAIWKANLKEWVSRIFGGIFVFGGLALTFCHIMPMIAFVLTTRQLVLTASGFSLGALWIDQVRKVNSQNSRRALEEAGVQSLERLRNSLKGVRVKCNGVLKHKDVETIPAVLEAVGAKCEELAQTVAHL